MITEQKTYTVCYFFRKFICMVEIRYRIKNQCEIREALDELRNNFYDNFDRAWFYLVIDDLPIDLKNIKEIKEIFVEAAFLDNLQNLFRMILKLEYFIHHVRKFLLPIIKEKLRISHLHPNRLVKDKNMYVTHSFIAYVLPFNLDRLNQLTIKLKDYVLESFSN